MDERMGRTLVWLYEAMARCLSSRRSRPSQWEGYFSWVRGAEGCLTHDAVQLQLFEACELYNGAIGRWDQDKTSSGVPAVFGSADGQTMMLNVIGVLLLLAQYTIGSAQFAAGNSLTLQDAKERAADVGFVIVVSIKKCSAQRTTVPM